MEERKPTAATAWRKVFLELRGYLLGTALVAVATWLKYLAQPSIIPADAPILYLLAVVPTALYFGLGPSVFVCILSMLAFDYFFTPPLYQIALFTAPNGAFLAVFLGVGLLIGYLAFNLRRRTDRAIREIIIHQAEETELVKSRDRLENLVKERTKELEEARQLLSQEIAERKKAQEALAKLKADAGDESAGPEPGNRRGLE